MPQSASRRPISLLLTAILVASSSVHIALAADISALIDTSLQGVLAEQVGTLDAQNTIEIVQDAVEAMQQANAQGDAATVVEADQTLDADTLVDVIQENCGTGTGLSLCLQHAAPQVVHEALQHVTATAANLLTIAQQNVTGPQQASLSGSALVDVDVSQIVTPTAIVNIFQDCDVVLGGCVQRAMPDILTLATQIVSATAVNRLGIEQDTQSGSLQQAAIEATAQSVVQAEQIVHPRTILNIVQACKVDVGLCIQRAVPLIETLTQQVINAHADNILSVDQDGAETQQATGNGSGTTLVSTLQDVLSETEIHYDQVCSVTKGLCIQAGESGQPIFVFSDGETTETGEYNGVFDDSQLDQDFSRQTVGQVASGICPVGTVGLCDNVQNLLLWLFGPEPEPQAVADAAAAGSASTSGEHSSHRGHQTRHLDAILSFLSESGEDEGIAPGGFGGDGEGIIQRDLLCSMRRAIPEDSDEAVWRWTAERIDALVGGDAETILAQLHDESICPQTVAKAAAPVVVQFMPMADDGPLSTNTLWNDCVRGNEVTLQEIRSNPDLDGLGRPKTCADYHTQAHWVHPDLGITFTWDRVTGRLELPEGYFPAVHTL